MLDRLMAFLRIGIKARSLSNFIGLLQKHRANGIRVSVGRYPKRVSRTASVGDLGTFGYGAIFTAQTEDGRKIVYEPEYFSEFASERGFADAEQRNLWAIRNYLHAESDTKLIMAAIPFARITIIGPDEHPMNQDAFDRLHEDARQHNVTI